MSRLRRAVVQVLMQPVRARGVALPIDLRDELREAYYAEPDEDWRTRAEEAERDRDRWRTQAETWDRYQSAERRADAAEDRAEGAERKLAEAREVLRSAQWSSVVWSGETAWMACPSCERIDPSRTRGMPESLRPLVGHAPDCRLANVLGEGV